MKFPIWKNHQRAITSNWCSFWIWLVLTLRVEWKTFKSTVMSSDQPYPTDHGGIYDLPWIHGVSCYEFGAISRSMFELTQKVGLFRQLWMICSWATCNQECACPKRLSIGRTFGLFGHGVGVSPKRACSIRKIRTMIHTIFRHTHLTMQCVCHAFLRWNKPLEHAQIESIP